VGNPVGGEGSAQLVLQARALPLGANLGAGRSSAAAAYAASGALSGAPPKLETTVELNGQRGVRFVLKSA